METALKRRQEAVLQVGDLLRMARHTMPTAQDLHRNYLDRVIGGTLKGCPTWAVAYVQGYYDALTQQLYERDLIHGAFVLGRFYSTHSARPDYYDHNGISPQVFADCNNRNGHYWAESIKETEARPYWVSEA
jgi:hypothetical protein